MSSPAALADLKAELAAVAAPGYVPVHADFKYTAGRALRKGDGAAGRDGCLNGAGTEADNDIWDVQLATAAAVPQLLAVGYKVAADADASWAGVPAGDTSVTVAQFQGEVNAWMDKVRHASCAHVMTDGCGCH